MRDADDEMPENHSTILIRHALFGVTRSPAHVGHAALDPLFLQFKRFGITLGQLKIVVCQVIKLIKKAYYRQFMAQFIAYYIQVRFKGYDIIWQPEGCLYQALNCSEGVPGYFTLIGDKAPPASSGSGGVARA